jgi:hypothetical protein
MTHPNNDFIKRFLGEDKVSPEQQKALLKKQRMENYYKSLEQKNILVEENKKAIDYTTKKIFSNTKPKTLVDLQEAKKAAAQWIEKLTPYGVFFYNKEQDVWMNNFGVIKKTLDELIQMVSSGYEIVSGGSNETQTIQSFFSDSGSKLALFNSSEETVSVYGISYSPTVSTTLLNTVNVGGVPFSAASNEKCFVSDDGEYLVLSSPNNKSVYFFDVNENALLQTVTEDQPLFGSLIAVDKDFYGMAISSTELNRESNTYDVRYTSWSACTQIHYYKRNFQSANVQKFKKVFSNHAFTRLRKSGLDGEGLQYFNELDKIPQIGYGNLQEESSQSSETGIYRYSDLTCKGYNYASANIALKTDQINYKSAFFNSNSPKYLEIYNNVNHVPPTIFALGQGRQYWIVSGNITRDVNTYSALPTDEQSVSIFTMLTLPSVKQFSITRKLIDGTYYDDKSYRLMAPFIPVLLDQNVGNNNLLNFNTINNGYFNNKIKGTFAEKTFIRGNIGLRVLFEQDSTTFNSKPIIDEQVLNTKIGINDTHTYHVSQILSNTNIKNIRIYRFYNTTEDGTTSFDFQDYEKTTVQGDGIPTPSIDNTGMIKILYSSTDSANLENCFFDSNTLSPPLKLNQVGICASKPFLTDPSNCPNSQFAFTINQSLLNQSLLNIFVSNDYVFLNFNNDTLVFTIDSSQSYKPLIYLTMINSISSYMFAYNANGNYFTKNNEIYMFDNITNNLKLIKTIGN